MSMKMKLYFVFFFFVMLLFPVRNTAQEAQESAEISLEAYSDAFQEHFFGALKEKAVENYEKAINLLLECKKLQPENGVVDYELGRNYLALKNYYQAEHYLKNTLTKEPDNIWYMDALFRVYNAQRNTAEAIKIGKKLAQKQHRYKEVLIALYARSQKYGEAIQLLDELDAMLGTSTRRKRQRARYQNIINGGKGNVVTAKKEAKPENNPLKGIQKKIIAYENTPDYEGLLTYMDEVLETYPSQSKFYYTKGKTLNQLKKHTEATAVLETALDFLVDDPVLENNIYRELVLAYQARGNTKKAEEYRRKLKNRT